MRGPAATLVAIVAVGLAVGVVVPRVTGAPSPLPEPTATPPVPPQARPDAAPMPDGPPVPDAWADAPRTPHVDDPEEALLWERLGGLGSLVLSSDRLVEACADPGIALPGAVAGDETGRADAAVEDESDRAGAVPEDEVVDRVVATTETLRGRSLLDPLDVRFLDAEAMAAEVVERFADRADPGRLELEERILGALGAIDPTTADLAELRLHAFAAQVSGLHAGEDGLVLLRVDEPRGFGPLEEVVLAHEVEHALTFQHLGRPSEHRDDGEHADAQRASVAVVEGSATAVMLQYARAVLDEGDRAVLRDALLQRAEESALVGYSPYLLAELRFPYTEGLRFACTRWLEGGWDAVDATYTEPPSSSAEVLFPERYGHEPAPPRALGELDEPWERVRTTTFGAAELLWLLEAPGGVPAAALDGARERAAAWNGGRLVAWTRGDDVALGVALVELDDGGDRPPLCDTARDWYAAAFPDAVATAGDVLAFEGAQQDAVLTCDGDQVRLGIAPTAADAATLAR